MSGWRRVGVWAVVLAGLGTAAAMPRADAGGGWSGDPAVNLAVADRPGDQVQVKLEPLADGGFYVSWYDNAGGGYDPALQRIDSRGVEQWPHNGRVVADTHFDWVTDYGLSQDSAGNALLAFRDDRSGVAQITVARVAPDGAMLWGDGGATLTQVVGDVFVGPPKVAGTTDGQVVVAWSEDTVVKVRRLDEAARPVWAEDLVLGAGSSDQLFLADLHAGPNGGLILSWTRTASFNAPRHLYAQRYTRDGTPLWGESDGNGGRAPLPVFVDGTLQYGNFPPFVPDLEGGAVFGWYETDPVLQVRVQHVRPDGSTRFPAGGALTASARPDLERVEPAVAYDTGMEDIYAFWRELPVASGPFRQALRGQRFDKTGQRMWGDEGLELEPMGGHEMTQLNATVFHGELNPQGYLLFAWVTKLAEGDQRVWARELDETGADAPWSPGRVAVSSVASGKARLALQVNGNGGLGEHAVLGWQDDRAGNDDIYLQHVCEDGSLCPAVATPTPTEGTATAPTPPSPGVPTATPSPIVPPTPRALYLPSAYKDRAPRPTPIPCPTEPCR